jgi:threonine/homoserine/homoserine lactone efflux protein
MLNSTLFLGFVAAALVVLVIPGPGVLYAVSRSAAQGYRAGLVSVLGLSLGALVHAVAAAIGLSAILLTSATAFGIVKLLGAAYLIYLGLRMILARGGKQTGPDAIEPSTLKRLLVDGIVISVFNPKIAVFFLAFLPQFVDPALGAAPQQLLLLGLLYSGLALLTDGTYALLAGGLRQWIGGRFMRGPIPRCFCGSLYIGLGIYAAFSGRRN